MSYLLLYFHLIGVSRWSIYEGMVSHMPQTIGFSFQDRMTIVYLGCLYQALPYTKGLCFFHAYSFLFKSRWGMTIAYYHSRGNHLEVTIPIMISYQKSPLRSCEFLPTRAVFFCPQKRRTRRWRSCHSSRATSCGGRPHAWRKWKAWDVRCQKMGRWTPGQRGLTGKLRVCYWTWPTYVVFYRWFSK